jgi:Tol biopolymer transport system component
VVAQGKRADIFSVGPAGGGMRVEVRSKRASEYSLDVSPDGSRLVFNRLALRKSTSGIYALSPSSDAISPVAVALGYNYPALAGPVFSPDGNRIAFIRDRSIYTMRLSGGAPKRITPAEAPRNHRRDRLGSAALSYFNSLDRRRSFRTRPSVCSFGQ